MGSASRLRTGLAAVCGLLLGTVLCGCGEGPATDQVAGGQLRLGSVLGETSLEGFERAEAPWAFDFPRDHGPHPGFRSEWWYLTAVLKDEAGADVGVQFTLFRQALAPETSQADNRWHTPQIYLAHFALTDGAAGRHQAAERFARGHPDLAGVRAEPFSLWLEDWRLEAVDEHWRLSANTEDVSVRLDFEMSVPIVLQGEAGLSRKGPGQASYYYSMPRIPARGEVRVGGEARPVQGLGWLDREWSTSVLSEGQSGWDWFALQFDDGRSLMVFQLRRRDGARDPYDQGMLVETDGTSRHLSGDAFLLRPTSFWQDAEGTEWPVAWSVRLGEEAWQVSAILEDQRMTTSIRYWEGMVAVMNDAGERVGSGYLELTGYEKANGEQR